MTANPFDTDALRYDAWYDQFPAVFRSEILALVALLPRPGDWIEVGVGTGRFAAELGIHRGIEPSEGMATLARQRGIDVIRGIAEALPLEDASVDAVFFITTLCFVKNVQIALNEALRVLRPAGHCIIGLLPLDSPLGQITHAQAAKDRFFQHARLLAKAEAFTALDLAGFVIQQTSQTLVGSPESLPMCDPSQIAGHDRGSFVGIRAAKPDCSSAGSDHRI